VLGLGRRTLRVAMMAACVSRDLSEYKLAVADNRELDGCVVVSSGALEQPLPHRFMLRFVVGGVVAHII
jgi:hypothetical protein